MTPSGDQQRYRLLRFALPLLLVLALAAGLTFQAWQAERARRQAVSRTLGDYADFAAFMIANNARQDLERRLLYAFGPIRAHVPSAGTPLPAPSVLGRDRAEASRCVAAGVQPSYVRVDLPGKNVVTEGTPLPPPLLAWLADTLASVSRSRAGRDWLISQLVTANRANGVIAYSVLRDTMSTPLAVYAKTSCLQVGNQSVFTLAMDRNPVLPPALTGGLPNDSLVSIRVTDARGQTLFESRVQYAAGITGHETSSEQWGSLRLAVGVRPEVAERLVLGGVSYSRMPLAALLLALIVLFAGLAFLQLRKQQEVMRLRESFISSVSHELRTPLQQVLLFSELLRMDKLQASERQRSLEIVERETRRLIHLVDNVLRFARAARGQDALALEPVALAPLAHDAIASFELLARANDVQVALQVEHPAIVLADANAIRRVLLNLLDNAVKYGPPGQTVSVRLGRQDHSALLAVEDQGPGVERSERQRIWQPFHRIAREEHTAVAGSGMGLAIVRDLVERMNGTVRVEDANGAGARFIVELPLAAR